MTTAIDKPDYLVYIDWNNDGDYSDALEDISDYLSEINGVSWGRDTDTGQPEIGKMTLSLDNTDMRFTPGYASSPYYPNVKRNLPIKISAVVGVTTYPIFEGIIQEWNASPVPESLVAQVTAVQYPYRMQKSKISTSLYQDKMASEIIPDLLPSWFTGKQTIDPGVDCFPWAGWNEENRKDAIDNIADSELAISYVGRNGYFRYEDRHHRQKTGHLTPAYTFAQAMEPEAGLRRRLEDVINEVSVEATPAEPSVTSSDVWTSDTTVLLGPQETQTVYADFNDLVYSPTLVVVANKSADGKGTDISSDIVTTGTVLYAKGAKIILHNDNAENAYLTTLKVTGYAIEGDSTTIKSSATDGELGSDLQSGDAGGPLISSVNVAQAIADYSVRVKKNGPSIIPFTFTDRISAAQQIYALQCEISDRVHIEQSGLGGLDGDFFIERIEQKTQNGCEMLITTLTLSPDPALESPFIVGTSKFNENRYLTY